MGPDNENKPPRPPKPNNVNTPPRPTPPKIDRSGGRDMAKQAASRVVGVGRRNSPKCMEGLCRRIQAFPNITHACAFAGITYGTLRYWLERSAKGRVGDGFDLTLDEVTKRFHEHWEDSIDAGTQMVEDAFKERALHGYYETLSDKGRVQYQYDKDLLAIGLVGPDAYLLDEDGKPIPERIHHQDPDVMQAVLKAFRRDRYGQHDKLDVTHRGGVMVVTAPALTSKELEDREKRHTEAPIEVEFREVEPE